MATSRTHDRPVRCLVIVPAFNESESVGKLVHHLHRALPGYDILVIDDGSTDNTARCVPCEAATVVRLPFNLGIGGAMQTGYRYAALNGYDVAVQVDGDGQHRPSEVMGLVDHLLATGSDLVVGSRFLAPGWGKYKQSLPRTTGSWILGKLIHRLSGVKVTDCTSGFRAVSRRVIDAFAHWYPEDYPEPEVVFLLHRNGFKVTETPVRMRQRRSGRTSIRLWAGVFYVMKVTTCLLLDMVREPWPRGEKAAVSAATGPVKSVKEVIDAHRPDDHPGELRWELAAAGGSPPARIQA